MKTKLIIFVLEDDTNQADTIIKYFKKAVQLFKDSHFRDKFNDNAKNLTQIDVSHIKGNVKKDNNIWYYAEKNT